MPEVFLDSNWWKVFEFVDEGVVGSEFDPHVQLVQVIFHQLMRLCDIEKGVQGDELSHENVE
jgi:hypothetical protein